MRLSTVDSALHSAMVGLGESYLVAFALAAGLGEVAGGLVTPVPQFAGAAAALLMPRVLAAVGSIRAVTVLAVVLQGSSLLAYAGAAVWAQAGPGGTLPAWVLFVLSGLYWTGAYTSSPVWNVWAGTMFPGRVRARFFGRRSRVSHVSTVLALAAGGLLLGRDGVEAQGRVWLYALLFGAAGAARLASAFIMTRQSERVPLPGGLRDMRFGEVLREFRRGANGRVLAATLVFNAATATLVSFLTPYLLDALRLPYRGYMLLIAAAMVTKALVAPLAGELAGRIGAARVVAIGACAVAPLPALWLVSPGYGWLVVVHVLSGAAWACYELSAFVLTFEAVGDERRVGLLARFNLLNNAALALGAGAGAMVLRAVGADGHRVLFVVALAAGVGALPVIAWALRGHGGGRGPRGGG